MSRHLAWMSHPLGAPTAEGIAANVARAKRWLRWLLDEFPEVDFVAEWILWGEVLDDNNPSHRARGLVFDGEIIPRLDSYWMVGGRISRGMAIEREIAEKSGRRVVDLTMLGEEPPRHGLPIWVSLPVWVRQLMEEVFT